MRTGPRRNAAPADEAAKVVFLDIGSIVPYGPYRLCGAYVPAALKGMPGASLSSLPTLSPDERGIVTTAQYKIVLGFIDAARKDPSYDSPHLPFFWPATHADLPLALQEAETAVGVAAGPRKKAKRADARIGGLDVAPPSLSKQDLFDEALKRCGAARSASEEEGAEEEE